MAPRFVPRRPLGRTGFAATALGAGDLADRAVPKATCVATLRRALDAGLNVVDTAPTLTCDPDVALLGLSFPNEQDAAFAAADGFRPMTSAEMAGTRRRATRAVEGKGAIWWDPPRR